MPRSSDIAAQLPFMRRYARALTGNQAQGDALVEAALTAVVANPAQLDQAVSVRMPLFAVLQREIEASAFGSASGDGTPIGSIPARQRQLMLLTALENFPLTEAAQIIGLDPEHAEAELDEAYDRLGRELSTSVLIIEDEPLIAMDLEHLVQDLGHRVTALAATRDEAIAAAAKDRPGLVLADIQLADGSSGIDAINDILTTIDVPVIFITAFPERLLTGEQIEPTFLLTKPFRPAAVRATISQALMFEKADV